MFENDFPINCSTFLKLERDKRKKLKCPLLKQRFICVLLNIFQKTESARVGADATVFCYRPDIFFLILVHKCEQKPDIYRSIRSSRDRARLRGFGLLFWDSVPTFLGTVCLHFWDNVPAFLGQCACILWNSVPVFVPGPGTRGTSCSRISVSRQLYSPRPCHIRAAIEAKTTMRGN